MSFTNQQEIQKTKLIVQIYHIARATWINSIFELPQPYQKLDCFESQDYINCPITKKTIQKWVKIKNFVNNRLEKHILNPNTNNLVLNGWIKHSLMNKITKKFRSLTYLKIAEKSMGVKGARLVKKAEWKYLVKVIFNNNSLGEAGVKILSKCQWKRLQQLQLNQNDITDKGFYYLLKSNWPKLNYLTLVKNKFTVNMINSIMKNPWPNLQTLDFYQFFYQFDERHVNQKWFIIFKHLKVDVYNCYRGVDQTIDQFSIFERSVVSLCISKEMKALSLGKEAINQLAEVKKLLNEGEFSSYQNL